MSTRINTNIEALNAQRNLSVTATKYASSVEKLSSGLRINRAADDAAGLAISEKLQAQVTGLNQAQRNAQDGVSMVQTAEGALNEVHSMLQRIRELAVEAGNSTLGSSDAQSVNAEITALQAEITRIASTTTFNGQNLLTGTLSVTQSGGTVSAGYVVRAASNTAVTKVTVTGAKGATTYTLSTTGLAAGSLKLSDASGNSQTLALGTGPAAGASQTLSFSSLGVSITVSSVDGETAANVASGLAAGGAIPSTIAIGGAAGPNLVNGEFLDSNNTVTAGGSVTYSANGPGLDSSGGTTPLTATGSPGMPAGTLTIDNYDIDGHLTGHMGSENFAGDLPAAVDGAFATMTLTGDQGDTVTLSYKQATGGATVANEAYDIWLSAFTFVGSGSGATVANMTAAPTAAAGTYSFSSTALGTITLTGPGGSQTITVNDTAANTSQTLDFNNLGISFNLAANGIGGFSKESAIGNLTTAGNDSIVVTGSPGSPGVGATVITGAGTNATFQIGANENETLSVGFADARASAFTGFAAAITAFTNATGGTGSITATAGALITATDTAIGLVSTQRAQFGAVENRLNHTVASISVASENLNASQSRIKDLDVAAEMVNFTKNQILQQAGTSILAQANSAPQAILTLLR